MTATYVIVGGGYAGSRAADCLRRAGFSGRIALVSEEAYFPYHRTVLSKQFLAGPADIDRLLLRHPPHYERQDVTLHLKAQATSIIVKSGASDDNPELLLSFHVLPRSFEDGLELMWEPKRGSDLDSVAKIITDKTIFIGKGKEETKMQTFSFAKPEIIRSPVRKLAGEAPEQKKELSPQEEIERAISAARE